MLAVPEPLLNTVNNSLVPLFDYRRPTTAFVRFVNEKQDDNFFGGNDVAKVILLIARRSHTYK